MLVLLRSVADFSRGCAGKRIGDLLFATHPLLSWSSQTVVWQHTVSNDSRRSESLFTAPTSCTGKKPQGGAIGHSPPAQGWAIRDSRNELLRINLPRTAVNRVASDTLRAYDKPLIQSTRCFTTLSALGH